MLNSSFYCRMQSFFVPEYELDESIQNVSRRIKRMNITWKKDSTFYNKLEVEDLISNECWSKYTNFTDTHGNNIVRYRCNEVKERSVQCAAALRFVFNSSNNEIDLYRSECKHTHSEILTEIVRMLAEKK